MVEFPPTMFGNSAEHFLMGFMAKICTNKFIGIRCIDKYVLPANLYLVVKMTLLKREHDSPLVYLYFRIVFKILFHKKIKYWNLKYIFVMKNL
jgi:hypothetical protein